MKLVIERRDEKFVLTPRPRVRTKQGRAYIANNRDELLNVICNFFNIQNEGLSRASLSELSNELFKRFDQASARYYRSKIETNAS